MLQISFCWSWSALLGSLNLCYFLTIGIHQWALQTCAGSGKWQQLRLPGKEREIPGYMMLAMGISFGGPAGFYWKVRLYSGLMDLRGLRSLKPKRPESWQG